MIGLAIALQVSAAPLADMKSSMQQVPVATGVALFKSVCFDPFPDPKAAMAVIDDPQLKLVKLQKTPTEAMQPGDAWTSPSAQVTYVDAAWMPMNMGSPQCSVTVALSGAPTHGEVATTLAAALGIVPGKIDKDGLRAQSMWDLPKPPDKWRMFLSTAVTPSGTEMRVVIMNLRGKAKKK